MIAQKLIHLIEAHADEIVSLTVRKIYQDCQINQIKLVSDREMRTWAHSVLHQLNYWLLNGAEIEGRSAHLPWLAWRNHPVPLHEMVRALRIMKHKTIALAKYTVLVGDVDAFPAELEYRIDGFFDALICQLAHDFDKKAIPVSEGGLPPDLPSTYTLSTGQGESRMIA